MYGLSNNKYGALLPSPFVALAPECVRISVNIRAVRYMEV